MRAGLGGLLLMLACWSGMAFGAPETGASPKLDLLEFQVKGNTVLSQMAIEEAVYPLLGPGKSVADVEKARAALEQAYHDAGYLTVYVSVPEQKVPAGCSANLSPGQRSAADFSETTNRLALPSSGRTQRELHMDTTESASARLSAGASKYSSLSSSP